MKHTLLAALSASFLTAAAGAQQATWVRQAPIPTTGDLSDVHMISPTEAWAASSGVLGGLGSLLHTTDAGATWESIPLGGGAALWAVFFLDSQRGWAAGNGFFHTTDGGKTWITDSQMGSIGDLYFLDAMTGWAAGNGGLTYRTTDGGLTWSFSSVGPITTLQTIWFTDPMNGWTGNIDGEIYRSTDGGQTWTLSEPNGPPNLQTLRFFDAQEGWAVGGNTFLKTVDGGQSWQQSPVPPGTWAFGATFLDDRLNGWAVGPGNLVRTTDGGASWQSLPVVQGPDLWDVDFVDPQNGMLVGDTGVFQATADGGASWTWLQSGGLSTNALDAVDLQYAWAATDGGEIVRTTDGGAFWERVLVTGFDKYGSIEGVDFVDPLRGWLIGDANAFAANTGKIAKTTDGGQTWNVVLQAPGVFTSDIEAIDAQSAYAFGWVPFCCDFLWRTSNGGLTWQDVSPGGLIEGMHFLDFDTGWTAGGSLKKTTDAGQTWTTQYIPTYSLTDVSFADALNGWATGWFGTLLHTTDGGDTWFPQSTGTGTSITFHGVTAVSPTTAWIVGDDGYVARTTDGGATWVPEVLTPGLNHYLTAEVFLDAESGWVASQNIPPDGGIWFRDFTPGCSPPVAYCTAKANSLGCLPTVGASGCAGASEPDPFTVSATQVINQKNGIFFYGLNGRAALPFLGGTLCAAPPLRRTPIQSSGGPFIPSGCTGSFSFDWNAWVQGGNDPAVLPGQVVDGQFWYRDPAHPDGLGAGLTDAIEFVSGP